MRVLRDTPRTLAFDMSSAALTGGWPFVPDAPAVRDVTEREVALERATRVLLGEHEAYRWTWRPRPRTGVEWISHPDSGFEYAADVPWWRVPHFDPRAGDIKDVWEPARFAWAYDLARGWMLTGDEAFVHALAIGVSTFLQSSMPFRGPLWACGQETAIRAIAWLWAEGACSDSSTFDAAVREKMLEALAWSGERIANAFAYAQSQRNNHGLSEATGLIAIGARLSRADPRAETWIDQGHRALESMILDQVAPDGWYIQHSFAYARVALDQLTTARRVLLVVGRDLSPRARERVGALIDLFAVCIDPETGDLPNHGPNDGAYILPLSTRPYRDFRPALTAAAATFGVSLPDNIEPEAETLAWLRAAAPPTRPAARTPWVRHGHSGWAVGATGRARVFARAGVYRSRPGHIDPAHLDVWISGRPVAIDAGTFRYAAPPPWNNGLTSTDVHNTITISGLPAARRGPRFLWLSWPRARIDDACLAGDEIRIAITNESWRDHGIVHRRECLVSDGGVLVIDEIRGDTSFDAPVHVHWLVEDGASVEVTSSGQGKLSDVRGDPASTRGWTAESYGTRRPVRSVRFTAVPRDGYLRIVSTFGTPSPSEAQVTATGGAEVPCST
jgi:hypothetical protein